MKNCQHPGCDCRLLRLFYRNHHDRHIEGDYILLCYEHSSNHIPTRNDHQEVVYQLQLINLKLHQMSQTGTDLKDLVTKITGSLQKIRVDVGTLAGNIPEGGLSAEEAAELKQQLLGVVTDAEDIDNLTADPETISTEPTV